MNKITLFWQRYVKSIVVVGVIMLLFYVALLTFYSYSLKGQYEVTLSRNEALASALNIQRQSIENADRELVNLKRMEVEANQQLEEAINEITKLHGNNQCANASVDNAINNLMRKAAIDASRYRE